MALLVFICILSILLILKVGLEIQATEACVMIRKTRQQ